MPWTKPYPSIDTDSAPFWAGLSRHEFLLFRCNVCGAWYWPKAFCKNHDNEPFFANLQWAPASGRGRVFTFSITRVAPHPGFRDDVPYVYALVELEEGPMFGSRIVSCRPEDVYVGMPVEVVYEDHAEDGFTLPLLRPQADRR